MDTSLHKPVLTGDYSNKNLQKAQFKNEELRNINFSGSDLRGADFSGADLTGADLTHVITGITPVNTGLIFLAALVVSAFSGYVAMLAGHTVQAMLKSTDSNIKVAGMATSIIIILFIVYSWWKGVGNAIVRLLIPVFVIALVVAVVAFFSGAGTGVGMLYQILALVLIAIMFVVGTIARATAGTLSNILFVVVALTGGLFSKSVGGGIGTLIMAISCALISKRALSGAKGFEWLRKIARFITERFGTSFRNAGLSEANLSQSKIHNTDFTNANVSFVNWNKSKKINCIN